MKRKDVNEVHDVFDFPLSSPALKIRRLDAEMTPSIMDQDETMNPLLSEQLNGSSPIAVDNEPVSSSVPENHERAIVLFNPNNDPNFLHLPRPPLSISADSNFLSGFKNPILWSNDSTTYRSLVGETQKQDDNSGQSNGSLAVVPWVRSHSQHPPNLHGVKISDMMDTDAMDVEDDYNSQQIPKTEWSATSVSQGLNPWQHHCMIEQPHVNLPTPITWFGRGA